METLLALFSVGGIVLIALSIPLFLQKVKPNPVYGFRVADTLNDEKTWYDVNRFGSKRLIVTGLATVAASFAFYPLGWGVDAYALSVTGVFGLTFVLGIIETFRYMRRIK